MKEEVLRVCSPSRESAVLLTSLSPNPVLHSDCFLQQVLKAARQVGLVHHVLPLRSSSQAFCVLIQYYSVLDASRAVAIFSCTLVQGVALRARRANPSKGAAASLSRVYPLDLARTIEFVNHFLGFNAWSSEFKVLYNDPEVPETLKKRLSVHCKILVNNFQDSIEAVVDESSMNFKGVGCNQLFKTTPRPSLVRSMASEALRKCLSKLLIYRFEDGRTFVMENPIY